MNISLPHQARRIDPMEARYQDATAFERARDEDVTVDVGDAPGRATVIVGDGEQAVRESVRQHIRDPLAGGAGTFRRGCSPP